MKGDISTGSVRLKAFCNRNATDYYRYVNQQGGPGKPLNEKGIAFAQGLYQKIIDTMFEKKASKVTVHSISACGTIMRAVSVDLQGEEGFSQLENELTIFLCNCGELNCWQRGIYNLTTGEKTGTSEFQEE